MSFALEPEDETASLVGMLDRLLDQGVHVAGDLVIGLADVDLIRASLRLLVASEDTAQRTGHSITPGPAAHRTTTSSSPPRVRLATEAGGSAQADPTQVPPRPLPRSQATSRPVYRVDDDGDRALVDGVAKLVLTVVAVIHDLVERQAIRRVEAGTLSDDQVERLGVALQALAERMAEVREVFGMSDEDLNLDLGPLGNLR